ncbi:MAG: hypothetical protein ABDH91_08860 [Bacteroidia bacterium]
MDLERRNTVRSLASNEVSGEFLFSLLLGKRYALHVVAPGYLPYSEHFDLTRQDTAYVLKIPLAKPEKGASVVLRNLFFDPEKATLKPESEIELEAVLRILKENPRWKAEA